MPHAFYVFAVAGAAGSSCPSAGGTLAKPILSLPSRMAASTCYTNAAALTVVLLSCSLMTAKPAAAATELPPQPAMPTTPAHIPSSCPPYTDTSKYRRGNFTDHLNTTVSISPKRPTANVPVGDWISGRATFYGADQAFENRRVSCGEPPGQFGVIEQGSCGYTNSDGTLPFPRDTYAAVADTNEDYPGSCGRCYQVISRCSLRYTIDLSGQEIVEGLANVLPIELHCLVRESPQPNTSRSTPSMRLQQLQAKEHVVGPSSDISCCSLNNQS